MHGTSPRSSNAIWESSTGSSILGRSGLGSLDAEPVEQALVATPMPPDLHRQLQVDPGAELALDGAAGRHADRLDHLAARPDQDALLGLGLDEDHGLDPHELLAAPVDVLDLDLDGMRHFLARACQHLFAHEL